MKIPFDIKYRPQIESGEYKVETNFGSPVEIVCWDRRDDTANKTIVGIIRAGTVEEIASWNINGKLCDAAFPQNPDYDLFIVTPEPELTEFEKRVEEICNSYEPGKRDSKEQVRYYAAELLDLAMKEKVDELKEKAFYDYWKQGFDQRAQTKKDGKAEALKEFEEKYKQSWFNEGKIAGRFEGLTEDEKYQQGVHDGKEEALKDLPRWSPNDIYPEINDVVIGAIGTHDHFFIHRGKIIHLESLEKLPGFKED